MKATKIAFAGAMGLALATDALAASTETIHINGTITESVNGTAIEGANVSLIDNSLSTTSDASGAYELIREEAKSDTGSADSSITNFRAIAYTVSPSYEYRTFDLNGRRITNANRTRNVNSYMLKVYGKNYVVQANKASYALAKTAEGAFDTLVVEKEGYLSKRIALDNGTATVDVSLDTIPVAIFLKRGAGSSSQSVAQNSAITDFNFAYENCDSVIVEGLPAGITATVLTDKKAVNFTGTVTADPGEYTYTMTSVGGYTTATRTGKFIVTEPAKYTLPKLEADGFASQNGGTTGGAGGDTVEVDNYTDFKTAVQSSDAKYVILTKSIQTTPDTTRDASGNITLITGDGYGLKIASNKTIIGADSSITIYGGLSVSGVKNVIIYNLNIHGTYPNPGPSDGIAVNGGSTNVWISHVNIWDAEDGNLDITGQASYVTVSYVHFWYTLSSHPHRLNALIGSGASDHPEDFGKLKVTYHHCWFGTLVNERMPRVMYGNAHIYNNYYTATDNLYCVGVGSYGSALIESNYFYKVNNPIVFMYNVYAYINTKNNKYDGVSQTYSGTISSGSTNVGANDGGVKYGERYITTDPYTLTEDPVVLNSVPYEYTADNVSNVPTIVKRDAGPHNLK